MAVQRAPRVLFGGDLAAELALDRNELLDVRVHPERVGGGGRDGRQRLAREPAVAVQLLEQELGAGDGRLRDREVAARDDALQALRLGQERRVGERRGGELEELCAGVLVGASGSESGV